MCKIDYVLMYMYVCLHTNVILCARNMVYVHIYIYVFIHLYI